MAKAVAGEAGVSFISASGSEFINKYIGAGADNVRKLFECCTECFAIDNCYLGFLSFLLIYLIYEVNNTYHYKEFVEIYIKMW